MSHISISSDDSSSSGNTTSTIASAFRNGLEGVLSTRRALKTEEEWEVALRNEPTTLVSRHLNTMWQGVKTKRTLAPESITRFDQSIQSMAKFLSQQEGDILSPHHLPGGQYEAHEKETLTWLDEYLDVLKGCLRSKDQVMCEAFGIPATHTTEELVGQRTALEEYQDKIRTLLRTVGIDPAGDADMTAAE